MSSYDNNATGKLSLKSNEKAATNPGELPTAPANPDGASPVTLSPVDASPAALTPADASPAALTPADASPAALTPVDASPAALTPPDASPAALTPADASPAALTPGGSVVCLEPNDNLPPLNSSRPEGDRDASTMKPGETGAARLEIVSTPLPPALHPQFDDPDAFLASLLRCIGPDLTKKLATLASSQKPLNPGRPQTATMNPGGPQTATMNPGGPQTSTMNPGGPQTAAMNPGGPQTAAMNPGGTQTTAVKPSSSIEVNLTSSKPGDGKVDWGAATPSVSASTLKATSDIAVTPAEVQPLLGTFTWPTPATSRIAPPRAFFGIRTFSTPCTSFGPPNAPQNQFLHPGPQYISYRRGIIREAAASMSTNATSTSNGNLGSSRGNNSSSGFCYSRNGYTPKPTVSYERVPLKFTLPHLNAHIANPANDRYRSHAVSLGPFGSQHFGFCSRASRIRKMELHPGHVVVIDTDQNKQRIQYETLQAHISNVKAAESFSMSSFSKNHRIVCLMAGWTAFLKPVTAFTLDGMVSVNLLKKLFPRLPGSLKTLVFLPHQVILEMNVADALNHIPKAVEKLIFDTTCFPDATLVTAVALIPFKELVRFSTLVLLGRRFPHESTFPVFFERLEALTVPGASVSLFSSNIINNGVMQSLNNWGFIRAYLHKRTFGNLYEMYHQSESRRYVFGFLAKKDPAEDLEDALVF